MSKIIHHTSPYVGSLLGPQRVDFKAGALLVSVHMHCIPSGLYAGDPVLMAWALPPSPDPEVAGSIMEAGGPLTPEEWEEAIAAVPLLAEVRHVSDLLADPEVINPRSHPEFLSLCNKLCLDPNWRPGRD